MTARGVRITTRVMGHTTSNDRVARSLTMSTTYRRLDDSRARCTKRRIASVGARRASSALEPIPSSTTRPRPCRLSRLTSAPSPAPSRADDHVRGDSRDPALVVMYADFTCPHCAVAAIALKDAGRSRRLPPLRAEGQAPALARARPRRRGRGAPGRVLGVPRRALRRPGPARRPAPVGRAARSSGLDLERFEADRRSSRCRRARRARRAGRPAGRGRRPRLTPAGRPDASATR